MKSIGYDVVEANDDEDLDENDSKLKVKEDLYQHERESGSDKCEVGYYFLIITYWHGLIIYDNKLQQQITTSHFESLYVTFESKFYIRMNFLAEKITKL